MDFTAFVVLSIAPFPDTYSLAVELLLLFSGARCVSLLGVDSLTHTQSEVLMCRVSATL